MVASFGSGAAFSLVSGVGGPNPIPNALSTGVVFALFQGAFYQVRVFIFIVMSAVRCGAPSSSSSFLMSGILTLTRAMLFSMYVGCRLGNNFLKEKPEVQALRQMQHISAQIKC